LKRVETYLSNLGYCSRKEVKAFLKHNIVLNKTKRVFNPSLKVEHCDILVNDEVLDDERLLILLHKPKGYICSHNDSGKLIYSLLPKRLQNRNPKISTIGRLDIDTTGAILLTDDGELNHKLTSPKKEIKKRYLVTLEKDIQNEAIEIFASGDILLRNESKPLKSAKLKIIEPKLVEVEIFEGKYHQVKRMFAYLNNKVLELHRVSFDDFTVEDLKEGEFKFINMKELNF